MARRLQSDDGPNGRDLADVRLHIRVVRSVTALWDGPVDVLGRVFDVAGFAVNTVLEVHLELRTVFALKDLVDTCGAVALRRFIELWQVDRDRNRRVFQLKVARLRLFVVGKAERHVGQAVKRQNAIGFRVVDLLGRWIRKKMGMVLIYLWIM